MYERRITKLTVFLSEEHKKSARINQLKRQNSKLKKENANLKKENEDILSSNSGKLTKGFRKIGKLR